MLLDADIKSDPLLGEDTWELFQLIQDSFNVDLGDYNALCGMTVRELVDEISRKANYPNPDRCLSAVSFFRLRRAFESFGIRRSEIRPSSDLRQILPWRTRLRRWRAIEDELKLELPKLGYPGWVLLSSLVGPATILICLRVCLRIPLDAYMIAVWSLLLIVPAAWALSPFARSLPPEAETVGGLAKLILARNYAVFAQNGGSSGSDLLKAVQQLVATQSGKPLESIFPETRIPQDLDIY